MGAVFTTLLELDFTGVLTLEVFGEEDFATSIDAVLAALSG
ncbi:MAG: hypothetical protein R3A10_11705 [Caldilineaceae bacterium]